MENISTTIANQHNFFANHQTKNIEFRVEMLKKLRKAIVENEKKITDAIYSDFNKSEFEAYITEILMAYQEIDFHIKHLKKWAKPKRVKSGRINIPAKGYIVPEPFGVALIMAPWNYPFQLLISPLVGAIAAGNCAVLKPSELSVNTSHILVEIIEKTFSPNYISIFTGGIETNQALLAEKYDFIFFTGSTSVGKLIMAEAAKNLTPICLELGGKSPCIVDEDANIENAANRIAWGKFVNAGQTCIAPDYLFVHQSVKDAFLNEFVRSIQKMYGTNPIESPDFTRIINERHFERVVNYLSGEKVFFGGQHDKSKRYIAPTVLIDVLPESAVMQDEIFGPVLPVLTFEKLDEVIAYVNERPKPLALYYFSDNKKKQKEIIAKTSSGGCCINDTIVHIAGHDMPFGGVGNSGMGRYHGKASFDLFSNQRSVLIKSNFIDIPLRYAPYKNKLSLIKKLLPFLD